MMVMVTNVAMKSKLRWDDGGVRQWHDVDHVDE